MIATIVRRSPCGKNSSVRTAYGLALTPTFWRTPIFMCVVVTVSRPSWKVPVENPSQVYSANGDG
jgi:hypothetical protein